MCCVTLQRRISRQLLHAPPPSFVIPILRAPTLASAVKTTIGTTTTSTNKFVSAILKQETIATTSSSDMISQRTFENLVLTNTIVAAFCIVLMVTLTGFLFFLLIPSIRRRWLDDKQKDEKKIDDLTTLSRQQSFHHFTLGPSRLNPLFETTPGSTAQFGALFHPHTTAATLLHPTIWTQMTPASVVPTPPVSPPQQQQQPQTSSIPSANSTTRTTAASARPPLPSHPPTTTQRSPRKR